MELALLLTAIAAVVTLIAVVLWVYRDQRRLLMDLLRPEQPVPPPKAVDPPTLRATLPPIDPTDGVIPDISPPVGSLASAFPRVDPWLIGEPELPETIADTEFTDDEYGPAQVMDEDGNWVPITEAADRIEDRP